MQFSKLVSLNCSCPCIKIVLGLQIKKSLNMFHFLREFKEQFEWMTRARWFSSGALIHDKANRNPDWNPGMTARRDNIDLCISIFILLITFCLDWSWNKDASEIFARKLSNGDDKCLVVVGNYLGEECRKENVAFFFLQR